MKKPPQILGAPGLVWRKRANGDWTAVWQARTDCVRNGWRPTKFFIAIVPDRPDDSLVNFVRNECIRMQDAMLLARAGGFPAGTVFGSTLRDLINYYQLDRDSPYRKLRHASRTSYDSLLRRIDHDHSKNESGGWTNLADINARVLLRWHEQWTKIGATSAAHRVMMMRLLVGFGATFLEDEQCIRLKSILSGMQFKSAPTRKERLTADQANAIRAEAHRRGLHSIALAQAFQFECTLRQKDVIGEWVPNDDMNLSDVINPIAGTKWIRGLRWPEIADLVLRHITSKRQKEVVINLRNAPMVMEELALLGSIPTTGPIIIYERTGRPYTSSVFRADWRSIATACGIPKTVWNMDTRAGAISEATDAGMALELVRHAATHSNISTTQGYSRGDEDKIATVMVGRVEHRNKNRP